MLCSDDWRHISCALTPADGLTRLVTVHHMKHTELQQGPVFLIMGCDYTVDLASVNADLEVTNRSPRRSLHILRVTHLML